MNRVNSRVVPKNLNLLQKRLEGVAKDMLDDLSEDPTFNKRITSNDQT